MPHPTTLAKATRRFGPEVVEELNRALLRAALERTLIRSRRLRVDTTVVEADVRGPTDSGLCAHAVRRLRRAATAVKRAGLAARTRPADRRRRAGRLVRRVSGALARGGSTRPAVDRLTGELHRLADAAAREAARVLRNARRALAAGARRGAREVARLEEELSRVGRILAQTATRLGGQRTIPDRVIALADPDARPIRRGKPSRPTEFGSQASVADTPEGFVASHQVHAGNPHDAHTLEAAIRGAQEAGLRVGTALADRGDGTEAGDQALRARGVRDAVIPRVGRPAPVEATRSWRRRSRFRTGAEGRISALTRGRGWADRASKGMPEPRSGAATACSRTTWTGWWPSADFRAARPAEDHLMLHPQPPQQGFFKGK